MTPHYNELAKSVHPRFMRPGTTTSLPRISWKMSIDLSQPAVPSEGNLDPFDCYVTYRLLDQGPRTEGGQQLSLKDEIADMETIVRVKYQYYRNLGSLDLGEALWVTHWVPGEDWAQVVMQHSMVALDTLWQRGYFTPAHARRSSWNGLCCAATYFFKFLICHSPSFTVRLSTSIGRATIDCGSVTTTSRW